MTCHHHAGGYNNSRGVGRWIGSLCSYRLYSLYFLVFAYWRHYIWANMMNRKCRGDPRGRPAPLRARGDRRARTRIRWLGNVGATLAVARPLARRLNHYRASTAGDHHPVTAYWASITGRPRTGQPSRGTQTGRPPTGRPPGSP